MAAENGRQELLPLKDAVHFAMEEARLVVPGIQALFGFQLVAVFNERFETVFGTAQQWLHLGALALVALAAALAMCPAAYHRQVERGRVSPMLLDRASAFIAASMVALMIALSIDVALVTYVVSESGAASWTAGVACLVIVTCLWIVFPQWVKRSAARKS